MQLIQKAHSQQYRKFRQRGSIMDGLGQSAQGIFSLNGSKGSTLTLIEEAACGLLYILPDDVDMSTFSPFQVSVETREDVYGSGHSGQFDTKLSY